MKNEKAFLKKVLHDYMDDDIFYESMHSINDYPKNKKYAKKMRMKKEFDDLKTPNNTQKFGK
jgi:hypothetical protein